MNNRTYRIALNAAALLLLAQGKLEGVNLINWYPSRYYSHDSDPPFAELKLYQRAFCNASPRRVKTQLDADHAVLTFRLPTGPELEYEFTFLVRFRPERGLVELSYSRISYGPAGKDLSHFCPYGTGIAFYVPYLEARELCLIAAVPEEG